MNEHAAFFLFVFLSPPLTLPIPWTNNNNYPPSLNPLHTVTPPWLQNVIPSLIPYPPPQSEQNSSKRKQTRH